MASVDVPRYARERDLGIGSVFRAFVREWPPRALLAWTAGWLVYRLWLGSFSLYDLVAVAAAFVLQPFSEWMIHVFVLHQKPFTLFGRTDDLPAAQKHRQHHRDPWDLRTVVMPVPTMLTGGVITALVSWLVAPTLPIFATLMLATAAMSLHYEWVHFFVHTSYAPRSRFYKRLHRLHRLHHFKNENYWFGVTRHFGDVVLRTFPEAREVPTSETARQLLG